MTLPEGEPQLGRRRPVRSGSRAVDAGYLYRAVPKRYGGSEQPVDVIRARVIREEFALCKAPTEVPGNGTNMLVPTLLECGTEDQKQRFIRPTLEGNFVWGQGYSELNAGSDLASVRTRAELVGNEWVINGHKIWTSQGGQATHMFALVRTEPGAGKHEGISYLLVDLDQPGVVRRPIRQLTGEAGFFEFFFDDVRTPADWLVGEGGKGWIVSRTTLAHERASIGSTDALGRQSLQIDPPDHTKYRKLLASALAPGAVESLGEDARALAIRLIDGFKKRGECEFVSEFAQHLPIAIFMKMVGLPESERPYLTKTAGVALHGETEAERNGAQQALAGYGMQKALERRANPGKDLISTIRDGRGADRARRPRRAQVRRAALGRLQSREAGSPARAEPATRGGNDGRVEEMAMLLLRHDLRRGARPARRGHPAAHALGRHP